MADQSFGGSEHADQWDPERITIVQPLDERTCSLTLAGDSLASIAIILSLLDADFDVTEPAELRDHLSGIATRFRRAAWTPHPSFPHFP